MKRDGIVLPIKAVYADKILNGEKKYEYRKKLCGKPIDTIYLYATAPIKRIVGEVEVIKKVSMKKEELWEASKEYSGISKEFFMEYFQKSEMANAYYLGKTRRYRESLLLSDIGILYTPQAFVYVNHVSEEKPILDQQRQEE